MPILIHTEAVPLRITTGNAVCIAETRVTLDSVIYAFLGGATAEEIVQQYPSLSLADIYAVIAYYLRHTSEIEQYLSERQKEADELYKVNEQRFNLKGIRERLIARKNKKG